MQAPSKRKPHISAIPLITVSRCAVLHCVKEQLLVDGKCQQRSLSSSSKSGSCKHFCSQAAEVAFCSAATVSKATTDTDDRHSQTLKALTGLQRRTSSTLSPTIARKAKRFTHAGKQGSVPTTCIGKHRPCSKLTGRPFLREARALLRGLARCRPCAPRQGQFLRCSCEHHHLFAHVLSALMVDLASNFSLAAIATIKKILFTATYTSNLPSPSNCFCSCGILAAFQGAHTGINSAQASRCCRRESCGLARNCAELLRICQHGHSHGGRVIYAFKMRSAVRRFAVKRATKSELNDRCKDKQGSSDDVHTSHGSGGKQKTPT